MNNTALYIVRQNFDSKCFKCKKEKKFFTVYRCGKCNPQTIEKYCYECCEESLIVKEGEDSDDDDTNHISALCMGCAFCYDYILVSEFYKKEKENGWQSLKYDCDFFFSDKLKNSLISIFVNFFTDFSLNELYIMHDLIPIPNASLPNISILSISDNKQICAKGGEL